MKCSVFSSTSRTNLFLYLSSSWLLFFLTFLYEAQAVQSLVIKSAPKFPEEQNPAKSKSCDFNDESKDHSISDLLRCTDDLAARSLPPTKKEFSKELDQVFENYQLSFSRSRGRQGFGLAGFPYDNRPQGPFYRPGGSILDSFGDGSYGNDGFSGYAGPYDPSGTFNLGLAEALNSISQYDDLKCVPRLLCEIATGSKPGNGGYKASSLEDFGKNTLLGLLTSYNFGESSPVLSFGKAALLGYTSRGDSSICYEEYDRCPSDPRDLVYYLNNHNGGFFRFFKNSQRRQVSQLNRIGSNRISTNRVGFSMKEPAPPPGLSGPESDRTGTGELKFDTPEPSPRRDVGRSELRLPSDVFSRVVFPGEEDSGDDQGETSNNRFPKSVKFIGLSGFFPETPKTESENSEPTFFPSDYEEVENTNVVFESGEDSREQNYYSYLEKGRLLVPDDEDYRKSVFTFPDRRGRVNFDS